MSSTERQSKTAISDNIVEEDPASKFPSAVKNKSNSLPKSAFSNIQLRVQEIRDQLEVLKASSSQSGSKALQQVFPRMRPPSLTSQSVVTCPEPGAYIIHEVALTDLLVAGDCRHPGSPSSPYRLHYCFITVSLTTTSDLHSSLAADNYLLPPPKSTAGQFGPQVGRYLRTLFDQNLLLWPLIGQI